MKTLTKLLLITAIVVGLPSLMKADVILQFSDGTITGDTFSLGLGETRTIQLLVTETNPNTELSTDGLIGFGVHADYAATSGSAIQINTVARNTDFDFLVEAAFTGATVDLAASSLINPPVVGSTIVLGEMQIEAVSAGETLFTFDDYDAGLSDFVTSTATDLDPTIFSGGRTFGLTIIAVPEPTGAFVLLGTLGILAARRKRRLQL